MIRKYNYLSLVVAALVGAGMLGMPTRADAAFQIRATEFLSNGTTVDVSHTISDSGGPGTTYTASFSGANALNLFTVTVVTNTSDTGPGFSAHTTSINVSYKAGAPSGTNSHSLFIEVLGDSYMNPAAPALSFISSNASPSTAGLKVANLTMTSGVINSNVVLSGTPGTPLGGQLGMTTGTGTMGNSSSVLMPNPANGGQFAIANPFSFYQTYTFDDVSRSSGLGGGSGSLSSGSIVQAVPAPPTVVLCLLSLPLLAVYGWLRRIKAVQLA